MNYTDWILVAVAVIGFGAAILWLVIGILKNKKEKENRKKELEEYAEEKDIKAYKKRKEDEEEW